MSQLHSLTVYDVKAGQTRELMPEKRITSYELAKDGSFLTYYQDITKKTDYDVINGVDNHVRLMPLAGGQSRSIIKDTHGLTNIIWSKEGRHYAYAKQGNAFFGSIDDKEARQLTGKKDEKPESVPRGIGSSPRTSRDSG